MNLKACTAWLAGLLLGGSALALPVKAGGKVIGQTLTQGGKVYVSLETLKAAGISYTLGADALLLGTGGAGGQNQTAALSGCVGQTLFNGVWRLKVQDIQPALIRNKAGWEVTLELRNATPRPISLYDSGFTDPSSGSSLQLAYANDSTVLGGNVDVFKKVTPAAAYVIKAQFRPSDEFEGQTPTKLLWLRQKVGMGSKLPYNTAIPSFRIDLTCPR